MTLPNGLPVYILGTNADGLWAHIAYEENSSPIGWVYRPYMSC